MARYALLFIRIRTDLILDHAAAKNGDSKNYRSRNFSRLSDHQQPLLCNRVSDTNGSGPTPIIQLLRLGLPPLPKHHVPVELMIHLQEQILPHCRLALPREIAQKRDIADGRPATLMVKQRLH
jgi:hypothetical protein